MAGHKIFTAAAPHLRLGRMGEDAACAFLRRKGFVILARNWRPERTMSKGAAGLELDLVGRDGGTLVFVEVKTRRSGAECAVVAGFETDQEDARAAFTPAKQRKILRAARYFLAQENLWDAPCRFDLVCVTVFPDDNCRVEHHVNAVDCGSSVVPFMGGSDTSWQPW